METYKIYLKGPADPKLRVVDDTGARRFTVEDLKSNSEYKLYVTAVAREGDESMPSNEITVKRKSIPPPTPENVRLQKGDTGNIRGDTAGKKILQWDPVRDVDDMGYQSGGYGSLPVWADFVLELSGWYIILGGSLGDLIGSGYGGLGKITVYIVLAIFKAQTFFTFDAGVTVCGISGSSNVVIVKYGFDGTPLWARSVTAGSGQSRFQSVSAGSDGVHGAGVIVGTGSFDFGIGIAAAGPYAKSNVVLVKYNFNGTAQWARTVSSGAGYSTFYATAVIDVAVYAVGHVAGSGAYTFGPGVAVNASASTDFNDFNAVLVKYDSNGTAHWARTTFEGSVKSSFSRICRDGNNNYSAGYISGITRYGFGNNVHVTGDNNNYNALIVKYRSRNFN